SPSSGFVSVHGQSLTVTVTAQRTFGPSHTVQYSCAGLTAGATCTFTPPSGNPTSTANLTLATSSSTPPGTYVGSVQATDGTITRISGFTLTVGDPLLAYDMETLTGAGLMKDLSGHGNDGSITGTIDVAGKVGRARQFNGIVDVIQSPSFSRPANGTFALWVKPDVSQAPPSGTYPQILSFNGDPGIYIQSNTGRPYLQIVFPTAGVQAIVASTPVSSDTYTHVAGTWNWDGTNTIMRIYVNGVEDAIPLSVADHLGLSRSEEHTSELQSRRHL